MSGLSTVTPNDLYEKAEYFHVDLADEPYLIPLTRQAVITPLPPQWRCVDKATTPQYRNEVTGELQTSHPADVYFRNQILELRQLHNDSGTPKVSGWMEFDDIEHQSTKYYYDFVSKTRSDVHPMVVLCDQTCPSVTSDSSGTTAVDPKVFEKAAAIHTKSSMKDIETLEVLCFTSWWTEMTTFHGEKKSRLQIYFSIPTKYVQVVLEDSDNVFTISHLVGTTGEILSAWDLHVGARIYLLGRWTTLIQPSLLTRQWLERHETKFQAMQTALYDELIKYELSPPPKRSTSGIHQSKSGPSLRNMLIEIEQLRERLAKYRPSVARRFILTQ